LRIKYKKFNRRAQISLASIVQQNAFLCERTSSLDISINILPSLFFFFSKILHLVIVVNGSKVASQGID